MEQRAHLYTLAGVCALPRALSPHRELSPRSDMPALPQQGAAPLAPLRGYPCTPTKTVHPPRRLYYFCGFYYPIREVIPIRLAAACTTGGTLPGMKPLPPFQVIYQTAEDGLGDTVKPRLIEAEADLDRVLVIDEAKQELTLSDERIEKAITQNGARLIILDPIQAYMGEKTDMNRANEVRPMFRRLADVAERTGCAVILIGHLNKAAGGQSAYRGLGSIDFRAAARSVLLIGRVKREPNVRVIVHDKSSLAPEGKPIAFCLDPETGFSWIGEYDITADELLSGAGGNTATKTEQAERLILDLLADGKELASEDIVKAAAEAGISERTVQNAKRNMGGTLGARRVGGQWYNFIKKKQPPEPAS